MAFVLLGVVAVAVAEEAANDPEGLEARVERLESLLAQRQSDSSAELQEERWYETIEMAFGLTAVLQGSSGASEGAGPEGDVTDGSAAFDLGLTAPPCGYGTVCVALEVGDGDGIDGDIANISSFNDSADDDPNVRLAEQWYEHRFLDEGLALKIGNLDMSGSYGRNESAFDGNALVNDECAQFLSAGFVNSLAVEFPDDNGPGAIFWASPHDSCEIGIGVADADGDWEDVFDNLFSMIELDLRPSIAGRPGSVRVYGWCNDKDHVAIEDPAETRESGHGYGLSFDQEVFGSVSVLGRYARQRESTCQVACAWSAGGPGRGSIVRQGGGFIWRNRSRLPDSRREKLAARSPTGVRRGHDPISVDGNRVMSPDHTCSCERLPSGFACGLAEIGDGWRAVAEAAGGSPDDEYHAEIYYRIGINEHLSISPDVQWIRHPDADGQGGRLACACG